MNFNPRKAFIKIMMVSVITLLSLGTFIKAEAWYVDWTYVSIHASQYQNHPQFKPWLTLFKMLKANVSKKTFAEKYAETIRDTINTYLKNNIIEANKKTMLEVVAALASDAIMENMWNNSSWYWQGSVDTNIWNNSFVKPQPVPQPIPHPAPDYNANAGQGWTTPAPSYDDEPDFNNMDFDGGGSSHSNSNTSQGYSADDLWRDMWSWSSNKGYARKIYNNMDWSKQKTKSSYDEYIRAAALVRTIVSENDSDSQKIEKIWSYLVAQRKSNNQPDGWVRGSAEYQSWASSNPQYFRGNYVLFNHQWTCEGWNDAYKILLMVAWVKSRIQVQSWVTTNGGGHEHLVIDGKVSDVMWDGSAFSSQIYTITNSPGSNVNPN